MSAEPVLVQSPFCRKVEVDGHAFEVSIYRLDRDADWILEVVDEDGTSHVWDDKFTTDHAALAEALQAFEDEGAEGFAGPTGGHVPLRPPSPSAGPAHADLARQLETVGAEFSVDEVLGKMTAVVTRPTMSPPSEWIGEILGDASFENGAMAQEFVGLLMVAYNDIVGRLQAGEPVGPRSDEHQVVEAWCRGYADEAFRDPEWTADAEGIHLLLPFAVLGGRLDDFATDAEAPSIPEGLEAEWRKNLSEHVAAVHEYWAEARMALAGVARDADGPELGTYRRTEPKIGRNQPCPCGSGKKYKRCCGAH